MNLCRFILRHWLACHVLVWLGVLGMARAEELGLMRPIRWGWTAGVQPSYHITSVPGPYLRLQDVHAVFSRFQSKPGLPATVADDQALLLAEFDARVWPREDTGLAGQFPLYLKYDWPWIRAACFSKVRFTDWELKLPGHATEYDHAVEELRVAYLLYETCSMELLAQSTQSLDELAVSALIVRELEKAGL